MAVTKTAGAHHYTKAMKNEYKKQNIQINLFKNKD
jgi:hypothetical protein